ncbi:MAG: nitrilase-related carbon-nitrogen hydrolase [Arcicella sp.]|nr:nitrilase-related carbon-nitrogen hydrolase [Arcicella sp.]
MFNTGFTMDAKSVAEPMNFTTFKWLRQQAKKANAVITGSFILKEGDQYFNRLIWMRPDGSFEKYDKRHLFRMGNEHLTFTGGTERIIVELKGWKICPLICYDLRFPVWSRNNQVVSRKSKVKSQNLEIQADNFYGPQLTTYDSLTYDLLIYVANWPSTRSQVWDVLLQARAIENQSYCIGVNRVGDDGMGLHYSGNSSVIDFKGNSIFYQKESEVINTQTLNHQELIDFRTKFPAYLDADNFLIQ